MDLLRHVLIADDLKKKMAFDAFPMLEALTLKWPTVLSLMTAAEHKQGTTYLFSDESTDAIVDLVESVVKAAPQRWIQKLLARKRKKFKLQVLVVVGCKDRMEVKGNQLVVSFSSLLHCHVLIYFT